MAVLEEGAEAVVTPKPVPSSVAFFRWESGLLREWFRVVAYCPSCQTSLSNAEVNQGYETVEDPSFYYKVKLREEDAYMIVWTTMPFTIVTDEMVGANPKADYNYVRMGDNELWIVGADRMNDLMKELHIKTSELKKRSKGATLMVDITSTPYSISYQA